MIDWCSTNEVIVGNSSMMTDTIEYHSLEFDFIVFFKVIFNYLSLKSQNVSIQSSI